MNFFLLKFLFVTSILAIYVSDVSGQEFRLSSKLEGVEGRILRYPYDFSYELIADGESLSKRKHRVSNKISDKFTVILNDKAEISSLTIKYLFKDYETAIRTVRIDDKVEGYSFGKIEVEPKSLIISDVSFFPNSSQDSLLEFLITLRNSTGETVKLQKLEIDAEVKPHCNTPSPVFAEVKIDDAIQYSFGNGRIDLLGSAKDEVYGRTPTMIGEISYDECVLHKVDLEVNLSAIIPNELHSQMRIFMPNQLSMYRTTYSDKMDYTYTKTIDEMDKLLRKIPNITFKLYLDVNGQEFVTTAQAHH